MRYNNWAEVMNKWDFLYKKLLICIIVAMTSAKLGLTFWKSAVADCSLNC